MKKLLLLLFTVFCLSNVFSQENYVYCQLVGTGNLLGTKVTVSIDSGQKKKFGEGSRLMGADGKPIKFNSMIDALNYMGADGWSFVQAYAITTGNQNVYHYLLKKVASEEDMKEIKDMKDILE